MTSVEPGDGPVEGGQDGTQESAGRLSALSMIRKHAAVIVTLCLFIAGAYALYRLLAPLNLKDVLAGLRATSVPVYVQAMAATAAAYVGLIGYDWSALRYIGKRLPLPTVVLGGFLGYALGNTIGLSALSGGAVRYRIYSALGLSGYDVLAVATFAAISYGLGATMIGVGALAVHPAALAGITAIAPETLRFWSLIGLVGASGTLVALAWRGGTLRLSRFSLRAPSLGNLGLQLAFTALEIVMAAFVLHVLLPAGALPYSSLLAVYAIATMVGIASHVPGGVGVFESVVLAALPASVPLTAAVTALLLFRLIYFILPFVLALATLSLIEVLTVAGRRSPALTALAPVFETARRFIPASTGFVVLASGVFMMFAGLLPNPAITPDELETILPLAMIEGGALVSSILGAFLVVISISIFRRSRQAFWIVIGLLAAGIATAAFKTQDIDRVVLLGVILVILFPYRTEFSRTARVARGLWSVQWAGMILAILSAMAMTWALVHGDAAPTRAMWWQFGEDSPALTAGRAGLAAAVVLSLGLLASALQIARVRMRPPEASALEEAGAIVAAHGHGGDMLALSGDKMLMFASQGDAVLSYAVKGASWIALGAPVGAEAGRGELAWAFHDAARAAGARPVFYEAPEEFAGLASDMGLTRHKMGEEAVVPLARFSLDGPDRKKLRTTYARAQRDGLALDIVRPPHSDALMAQLGVISQAWLEGQSGREKRFSVGRFDPAWLGRCRIAVLRLGPDIVAFANILEAGSAVRTAAIDLMRQRKDTPANAMEFLFTALMLRLKDEGFAEFSLGMVPFAGIEPQRRSDIWARFAALVYERGGRFYNFDGLRRFKGKFDPDWRPRYLCCRAVLMPVGALADAARLIAGSARGIVGK